MVDMQLFYGLFDGVLVACRRGILLLPFTGAYGGSVLGDVLS